MSLVEYVHEQRWFGGKSLEVTGAEVLDEGVLRAEPRLADALVGLRYGDGNHDLYQLLLGDGEFDVIGDETVGGELVRLVAEGATVATADGQISFARFADLPSLGDGGSHLLGVEQSNSSLVVGGSCFVKVYRRLEAGENPDLELTRFLVQHGYEHVPRLYGWWSYDGPLLGATLGVVQQFVPGSVDGWSLALEELVGRSDEFVARIGRLGQVVGGLHVTLGSDSEDPAFCPEETSPESVALLTAMVDEDIDQVFLHLPQDEEAVAPIAGRGDAVRDLLRSLTAVGSVGRRIRHHGDLHLGQVLWADGDWLVIDFEGEPARPLPERRNKRSPLRDVAGMLRSFTYAASVAGIPGTAIEERARTAFLDGYLEVVQGSGLLPAREATERLLRIFELEKAVYELRYELAHRPDWVPVPVAGIVRLLEEAA
jgi:trehalose synthase-fused probable maltokinase